MQIYEGKSRVGENLGELGLGASVVTKMLDILETPEAHKVFFVNFFTIIQLFGLMKNLRDMGVRATGTVTFNKMNDCPITCDKQMKKMKKVIMTIDSIQKTKF